MKIKTTKKTKIRKIASHPALNENFFEEETVFLEDKSFKPGSGWPEKLSSGELTLPAGCSFSESKLMLPATFGRTLTGGLWGFLGKTPLPAFAN